MKTIIFTSIFMLLCSLASAQEPIEDPIYGSVVLKATVVEQNDQEIHRTSLTTVQEDIMGIGFQSNSTATDEYPGAILRDIRNIRGALEFSLENVPESITTNNFTAKLVGISGQPTSTSVSLSVDLFDMTDDQEDLIITEEDYDVDISAISINGDPFINGEFEDGTIDVTEQLRADLFGEGADRVSTGFILMASGEADMTGLVAFPGIADAHIELNLIGSDSDSDTDTDTGDDTDSATENQDTDTTPQVTDTSSDTTTQPQDTSSDTGTTGDTESEYWDTVDGSDDGPGAESSGEGNVTCNCSTAGAHSIGASILNLLF